MDSITSMGYEQHYSRLSLFRPGSSEMSIIYNSEGFPVRIIKNNQIINTTFGEALSMQALSSPGSEHLRNSFHVERNPQSRTRPPSVEQRARSLPRSGHQKLQKNNSGPAVERDHFQRFQSGWWNKGEVPKNKERLEWANTGNVMFGGDCSKRQETPKSSTLWKEKETNVDDIPAAGYSGHMPGLRHLGIGKPFNIAAREAKRDYALRRRARSGDRGSSAVSVSRSSNTHVDSYSAAQCSRTTTNYSHD